MDNEEDYEAKAKTIFKLINDFRKNPKSLSKHLEKLKTYLDRSTNVLAEPNKMQFQLIEGESIFNEAISFLQKLSPLKPFVWDDNLAVSAQDHVNDIGPKGLLSYQSSDGTEPEDRISKYGQFIENLGENIDFGPNDALGVIVSLTLDDGEENRPHRENIFKSDYFKIGIACGKHQSEYQMCVMDFAYDFIPLEINKKKNKKESSELFKNLQNIKVKNAGFEDLNYNQNANHFIEKDNNDKDKVQKVNQQSKSSKDVMKPEDLYYQPQFTQPQSKQKEDKPTAKVALSPVNPQEQHQINKSPYVKLSLDNEEFHNLQKASNAQEEPEDFDYLSSEVIRVNSEKKVKKKIVEVVTTVTYSYENGSTSVSQDKKTHSFNC